ncbi:MAG: hypothetical protein NTW86_01155 [Candidatus Sumerlaeota bacterium]|nr:hypothetical protein [Candidatus Sumerlaeota bacterium]
MEALRDGLAEFGALGLAIAFVLNILINSTVMYFVVNYLVAERGAGPFLRCVQATVMLAIVIVLSLLVMSFVPIPIVNLVLGLVVLYKGSIAVIEGCFEMTSGGLVILILYLIVGSVVSGLVKALGA